MTEFLSWLALAFAALSTLSFLWNLSMFRTAVAGNDVCELPSVSVLIPARDEEHRIRKTLDAVLANRNVDLEVLVLDDQSQDRTPHIVREMAARDARVRLLRGGSLPNGWCGKQYACYQLAQHAAHGELLFIDADVTLAPDAIGRCVLQRRASKADLLSGFPRQRVGSLGEAMLIPLIYIVLLTYLSFRLMRVSKRPAASAGCGQLFVTSREAYRQSGGHAAIKASLHDGVTLPRAYRRAGLRSDLFDASDLAECRMYRGWSETCRGLMKNAHEGMANVRLIVPASLLMAMGYLAPTALAIHQLFWPVTSRTAVVSLTAALISYLPRVVTAARFDRSWLAVLLFPLSILLFLILQWVALARNLLGAHSSWRGRAYIPTNA